MRLFPSAIACSCGERFESDWSADGGRGGASSDIAIDSAYVGSALWLHLVHQATVLTAQSGPILPHRVEKALVRCLYCSDSVDIDNYSEHLQYECDHKDADVPDAVQRYRKPIEVMVSPVQCPTFECASCLQEGKHCRHRIGETLEHEHVHDGLLSLHYELYLPCRACSCRVPLDNAVGHAAFWHPDRLKRETSLADLFATAPVMRPIPAGIDSIYADDCDDDDDIVITPPDDPIASTSSSSPTIEQQSIESEDIEISPRAASFTDSGPSHPALPALVAAPHEDAIATYDSLYCVRKIPWSMVSFQPIDDGEAVDASEVEIAQLTLLRHNEAKRPNECELCGKRIGSDKDFITHSWKHTGERRFGCKQCRKKFTSERNVTRHVEQKHSAVERAYRCLYCPAAFHRKETLVTHTRMHTGECHMQCEFCPKRFRWKQGLQEHTRVVHTKERPFECQQCDAAFFRGYTLRRHERDRHGKKYVHQCRYCDEDFCSPAGRLQHERRWHTGERPFKCTECNVDFLAATDLNKHRSSKKCKGNTA